MSAANELPLSEAAPASAQEKYQHRLAVYAERYGTHVRNLKNWIAIGRKHDDKPPLDSPADMATWWARRMQHRVPEKFLALARQPSVSCNVANAPIGSPPESRKSADSRGADTGSGIERLREAERAASEAYLKAVELMSETDAEGKPKGNPGDVEIKQRQWERLADMLRKAEGAAIKFADMKGDNLPRREVARQLQEIHSSLADSMRGLLERVRPKLKGKTDHEQDLIWRSELDRVFTALPHDLVL